MTTLTKTCPACEGANFGIGLLGTCRFCGSANLEADAVDVDGCGTNPIDFDAFSAPIAGETKATVELVNNDWRADRDWRIFENACRLVARGNNGVVDPNLVRAELTDSTWGELRIEARRYSAFWSRAASKSGFLVKDGWTMNDDVKSGNRGKPTRTYALRAVEVAA